MRSEPSVVHVDLDAFFAAVEQRDKPSLRDRPVIVGGLGPRGVVATASYEARRHGVNSAMPMAHARARCPQAAFLAPRFRVYAATSEIVLGVLRQASERIEPQSLDEAYVDLAVPNGEAAGPLDVDAVVTRGRELKSDIRSKTGLVASVGAGTSKLVAKVASALGKPDGLLVIAPGDETELLAPLPVSRLPGVGPATAERLRAMGVHTVAELTAVDRGELMTQLGKAHGEQLWRLARAEDPRPVDPGRVTRSISVEDTFERDVVSTGRLTAVVDEMADRVADRLRADHLTGRTVTVKVRRHDFATVSRSATLPAPTDDTRTLTRLARLLLGELDTNDGVRLLGVGVSELADWAQGDLFATEPPQADGPAAASRPPTGPSWRPGEDVLHTMLGPGWVQGSGLGRVTVRFETRDTPPGRARTFRIDDPDLRRDPQLARTAAADRASPWPE